MSDCSCNALSELLIRHIRKAMLDLHLLRLQLGSQPQPNMRHFLADPSEYGLAVLLELAAERIDVGLVDLIPRAFRAAGIMRITALALLPGRP